MDSADRKASLQRVRDNQRRSRARKREYMKELEEKFRNCELLGVEASAEIQAAARKVADENRRLRALLLSNDIAIPETEEKPTIASSNYVSAAPLLEKILTTRKPCCGRKPGQSTQAEMSPTHGNQELVAGRSAPGLQPEPSLLSMSNQPTELTERSSSVTGSIAHSGGGYLDFGAEDSAVWSLNDFPILQDDFFFTPSSAKPTYTTLGPIIPGLDHNAIAQNIEPQLHYTTNPGCSMKNPAIYTTGKFK